MVMEILIKILVPAKASMPAKRATWSYIVEVLILKQKSVDNVAEIIKYGIKAGICWLYEDLHRHVVVPFPSIHVNPNFWFFLFILQNITTLFEVKTWAPICLFQFGYTMTLAPAKKSYKL